MGIDASTAPTVITENAVPGTLVSSLAGVVVHELGGTAAASFHQA
jgi:hypothetical protein